MSEKISKDFGSYESAVSGLSDLGSSLQKLVKQLLEHEGISVYTVDFRVKTEQSANNKLSLKPGRYTGIGALTDLLGLRVTCYFSDQVREVAKLLGREFAVDLQNSVDKGAELGVKEFGYNSVHRIVQLSPSRAALTEYRKFSNTKFEIQIRSVLQHAWSEIEHDLGYKREQSPEPMKRRFALLAAVLELVDSEFMALRDGIVEHQKVTDEAVAAEVLAEGGRVVGSQSTKNSSVSDDSGLIVEQATLVSLLKIDPLFSSFDQELAAALDMRLEDEISPSYVAIRVDELEELGISQVNELRQLLNKWRDHILDFAPTWYSLPDESEPVEYDSGLDSGSNDDDGIEESLSRGIGIFYLWIVLSAEAALGSGDVNASVVDWERLTETWEETKKRLGT